MAEHRTPARPILRRLYRSPWLVVFVGLLATMLLFLEGRKAALSDFRSRFEVSSTARATRVFHEMDEILSITQTLSRFIQGTDNLDRDEFSAIATPFLLARKDLKGVGWVPVASRTDSGSGERTAGREKTGPLQSSDRCVISYAEPADLKGAMSGIDLGSVAALRSAMDRSRDTGNATASAWMGNGQSELLVFLPIYEKGQIPATPGERRRALRGFVLGFLHLDQVLSDIFTTAQPEGLAVEFLDYFTGPQGCTVYSRSMSPESKKHSWVEALLPAQSPHLFKGAFAGRQWGIRVTPGQVYVEKFYNLSYWFMVPTGFALTFLLALYRRSILSQWTTMERTITERKKAEEALKESENMFRDLAEKSVLGISLIQDGSYKYVNAQFAAIHGRTIEEMIDRPASLQHVHPEDTQRVSEQIWKAPSDGHTPVEFRIVAKGGEVKAVLAYATATTHRARPAVVATLLDLTERKEAEEVIRENEVRLSHATNLAKIVYWEHDEARQEFVFNDAFYALYGTTAEAEGGYRMSRNEYFRRFVHPEDLIEARTKADGNRRRPDRPEEVEHRVVRGDGSIIHILTRTKLFRDAQGRVVKSIGANQDITERKGVEEALTWKTAFLEAQVNSSPDGILVIDSRGKTILRNQRMADIWKLPEAAAPGQDDRGQLDHAVSMTANPQAFKEKVIYLLRHPDETTRDEVKLKDGTVLEVYSCPVLGKDGSHYGRIWTFRDVTELRRYWDMLESLSTTDGLTDLPNRRRFDEFLNREWRRSMRDQSLLSLILMDIDFFKEFNDHYGHLAGDDCLRQVASVLREIVQRPGDLAARYGGEEFGCILPDTDLDGAMTVANTVRKKMEEANIPHFFSSVADHVTLSFGVTTLIPESGETPSKLIQIADDLLYSAKQNGRDQVRSWRQAIFRRRTNAK